MDSVVSFGLPDKKQSVVTIGIFPFHIQPDHSEGLTLMVNTGLSRGALSFRKKKKKLHRIIKKTTLLPLVLNKLVNELFTN